MLGVVTASNVAAIADTVLLLHTLFCLEHKNVTEGISISLSNSIGKVHVKQPLVQEVTLIIISINGVFQLSIK